MQPSDDFRRATHTIVLSDVHLTEAEPPHPRNPLWKRFKRPKHFVDRSLRRLLDHLRASVAGPVELVLNGDVFDFDAATTVPEPAPFPVSWLERRRGLAAAEAKSRHKMRVILASHPVLVEALHAFVAAGHRLVFVIGNHDLELHWPAAQAELVRALDLDEQARARVRFCEWFYVSNGDTLIEHGNQYDAYCACANPIHPLVRKRSQVVVRLPFGNLAGKLMLNGMGLFNPHVEASFIKESFWEYVRFFYQYLLRTQPLLPWTWFWSSIATFLVALTEALLAPIKDPLTTEARIDDIAERANATPRVVRSLAQLHVHPAIFDPLKVMRELWLDRALLLAMTGAVSLEIVLLVHLFTPTSLWWTLAPLVVLLPGVIRYARSVESDVDEAQRAALGRLDLSSQIVGVPRVVHGHTHREMHRTHKGVELLNTGTWSPAFHDPECTQPYGRKCFAWIRPRADGLGRVAELYEWLDPGLALIAEQGDGPTEVLPRTLAARRPAPVRVSRRRAVRAGISRVVQRWWS